ncbi:hypothetical protein BS47DRAFT_1368223 [Hydnum rufescens UP504]|uniref:Uncharacterized protein n=1 Tax=Hydnum rufescens UP504 TaxID=1448309 RepID=A0A9P6DNJ1_9AGAM|nr:hypothetical protein BS47DRAFT_1368223 [Hydnum rufescens UP504]
MEKKDSPKMVPLESIGSSVALVLTCPTKIYLSVALKAPEGDLQWNGEVTWHIHLFLSVDLIHAPTNPTLALVPNMSTGTWNITVTATKGDLQQNGKVAWHIRLILYFRFRPIKELLASVTGDSLWSGSVIHVMVALLVACGCWVEGHLYLLFIWHCFMVPLDDTTNQTLCLDKVQFSGMLILIHN